MNIIFYDIFKEVNYINRIKSLRLAAGMKQSDLARRLNVGQTTISNWENGISEPDQNSLRKIIAVFDVTADYILGLSSGISKGEHSGVKIPVLGSVPAGIPIEAVQDILDYEEISPELAATGEYFALQIKGDSMAPDIKSGDIAIVRVQEKAENGQVVVVMVNGDEATVKRIKFLAEGLMLLPNNPAYEPVVFTVEDIVNKPMRIIGRVVEVRRKY